MCEGHAVGEAMRLAVPQVFTTLRQPESIARKAKAMASRPEICAVVAAAFREAEVPIEDVVRRHVELIHDPNPNIALRALTEYWRLVLPKTA